MSIEESVSGGTFFSSWKQKMKVHFNSLSPAIWRTVQTSVDVVEVNNPIPEEESQDVRTLVTPTGTSKDFDITLKINQVIEESINEEVNIPQTLFGESSDDDDSSCLMAKGNKVKSLKKSGLSLLNDDSDSGDSEDDMAINELSSLSTNVIAKINFLLSTIASHEKLIREHEDTLDAQEDLLIAEKQKNAKLERKHAKDKLKIEELQELANKYRLSHNQVETSHDSLQEAYNHLDHGFKNLKVLYTNLQDEHETLKTASMHVAPLVDSSMPCSTRLNASNNVETFKTENVMLKSQLHDGLLKCHKGSKALKDLLSNQVENFNREGLGFTPKLTTTERLGCHTNTQRQGLSMPRVSKSITNSMGMRQGNINWVRKVLEVALMPHMFLERAKTVRYLPNMLALEIVV